MMKDLIQQRRHRMDARIDPVEGNDPASMAGHAFVAVHVFPWGIVSGPQIIHP